MTPRPEREEGFALLALIVVIFVILLFLGIAAPTVARDLRRERELEAVHRGNQYVRAIQLYYRKFQRYPGSMEQLEKSNNIRFLRKQYDDPFTGKPDWRLIHVGEAKTTVKGFFGKPLAGLPTAGIGSSTGGSSFGGTSGTGGSSFGATGNGTTSGTGTSSFGTSSSGASGATGGSGTFSGTGAGTGTGTGTGSGSSSGTGTTGGGIASQNATDFKGTGGPFVGIGLSKAGESIPHPERADPIRHLGVHLRSSDRGTEGEVEFVWRWRGDERYQQLAEHLWLVHGNWYEWDDGGGGYGRGSRPGAGHGSDSAALSDVARGVSFCVCPPSPPSLRKISGISGLD